MKITKPFYFLSLLAFVLATVSHCNNYGLLEKLEDPSSMDGNKIFVSSAKTTGSFSAAMTAGGCTGNGINRGLCFCQYLAGQAKLSNSTKFIPWLSETSIDARCIAQGLAATGCGLSAGSALYNTKKQLIALSLFDLAGGALKAPIRYDENGNDMSGSEVLTGTGIDGIGTGATCSDWTSTTGGIPTKGNPTASDSNWTNYSSASGCSAQFSVYCVQVP